VRTDARLSEHSPGQGDSFAVLPTRWHDLERFWKGSYHKTARGGPTLSRGHRGGCSEGVLGIGELCDEPGPLDPRSYCDARPRS